MLPVSSRAPTIETQALERIESYLNEGPAFVSFSGGKDSSVILHLARKIDPSIGAAFYDSGLLFTQTYRYLDHIEKVWNQRIERCASQPTALEALAQSGHWEHGVPKTNFDLHRLVIQQPLSEAWDIYQTRRTIYGVRAAESRERAAMLVNRGGIVPNQKTKSVSMSPIWDWRDDEIAWYITSQRIPQNPVYAAMKALGVPPRKQRTGLLISGGLATGAWRIAHRIDPSTCHRVEARLPILRAYR